MGHILLSENGLLDRYHKIPIIIVKEISES